MFVLCDPNNSNNLTQLNTKEPQFIKLLQSKWDEIHNEPNVLRYKIDNVKERFESGYLLLLNPDRGVKRRTPEQISNICQRVDPNEFNFTKASPKEIMFLLWYRENETNKHSIIVNVSPTSRYHSLLCPSVDQCLPQIITEDSVELVLQVMCLANDRDVRIGFNSLCGLASVNHLHYHIFLVKNTLPVESAKCKQVKGPLYCLERYPAPAFCFEINPNSIPETSKHVYRLVEYLLKQSIPHNLLITRRSSVQDGSNSSIRCIVWPRKSSIGVKQLDAFNVGLFELSGWFPIFYKEAYENLKAEDLECELRKWKVDNFDDLCEELKTVF